MMHQTNIFNSSQRALRQSNLIPLHSILNLLSINEFNFISGNEG